MVKAKFIALAFAALPLAACQALSDPIGRKPDGPLSKAEIDACLAAPHRVGDDLVSPKPHPRHVFRPGYNFSIKLPDGTYGYGYEEASDGHLLVKYPKHGTSFDYGVTRRGGVVYFGDKPTTCA